MELPVYDFKKFELPPKPSPDLKKIMIFVAWPYMNGTLHIGHLAGYLIPADIIARAYRLLGHQTLMISGSDCYGTPILITAAKNKTSPQEIVILYHSLALEMFKLLGLSFDNYSATVNPTHHRVVKEMFLLSLKNGFIFKKFDLQFFSPTLNRFLPDRFVLGDCPYCGEKATKSDQCENCLKVISPELLKNPKSTLDGQPVELKPSEHYFFDWPKLQGFLEKYVSDTSAKWRDWIVSETNKWLQEGLKPRAITRDLEWGIELPTEGIPGDLQLENYKYKRIYVWFEAVTGYLSSSIEYCERNGLNYEDFWLSDKVLHYYFMGKDNLPFHTLFWPGQLYSANPQFKLPDYPCINNYLLFDNQKFSKSKGLIIESTDFIKTYGRDFTRFYFATFAPESSDFNFDQSHFEESVNNLLIAKIGNYHSRVTKLAGENFSAKRLSPEGFEIYKDFLKQYSEAVRLGSSRAIMETIFRYCDWANKELSEHQPWKLDRGGSQFQRIISEHLNHVFLIFNLLKPVLLDATSVVEKQFGAEIATIAQDLEDLPALKINNLATLFQRI